MLELLDKNGDKHPGWLVVLIIGGGLLAIAGIGLGVIPISIFNGVLDQSHLEYFQWTAGLIGIFHIIETSIAIKLAKANNKNVNRYAVETLFLGFFSLKYLLKK